MQAMLYVLVIIQRETQIEGLSREGGGVRSSLARTL